MNPVMSCLVFNYGYLIIHKIDQGNTLLHGQYSHDQLPLVFPTFVRIPSEGKSHLKQGIPSGIFQSNSPPASTKTKNYQHLVTPNWICNRLIYPISSLLINSSLLHDSHWHILSFSDVKLQNNCWVLGRPRQRPPVECWQKWKAGVFKTTLSEGGWDKSEWNGPFATYHCIAWAELLEGMLKTQKPQ